MTWERDSDREENTDIRFLREGSHERPRKRKPVTSDVELRNITDQEAVLLLEFAKAGIPAYDFAEAERVLSEAGAEEGKNG